MSVGGSVVGGRLLVNGWEGVGGKRLVVNGWEEFRKGVGGKASGGK